MKRRSKQGKSLVRLDEYDPASNSWRSRADLPQPLDHIAVVVANGKLYLLTPNHDSADAYNQCKDLVASMVEVTGTVMERSGMMGLDVTDVKAADAVAK